MPVATPRTEPAGCKIGRVAKAAGDVKVTYSKHVARILRDRCVACHREGEIAPFALNSFKQAAGWASMIDEVVQGGRMPPWHASPEFGKFSNNAQLTAEEKQTIAAWVAAGAPEGDARDLPEPAKYVEGWRIPAPDLQISLPKTVKIPAEGTMPYENFVVDPKLKEDVWVRASQVRPGNPSVVHHLVVFVIPPGERGATEQHRLPGGLCTGDAAADPARRARPSSIPAGSKLMFQVHYTPRGMPQTDRSEIGLVFADPKTIRKEMTADRGHQHGLEDPRRRPPISRPRPSHRFDQDTLLYSLLPHMHLRGKAFRFEAVYPDSKREVLLDVPRYEFEWQNVYVLDRAQADARGHRAALPRAV